MGISHTAAHRSLVIAAHAMRTLGVVILLAPAAAGWANRAAGPGAVAVATAATCLTTPPAVVYLVGSFFLFRYSYWAAICGLAFTAAVLAFTLFAAVVLLAAVVTATDVFSVRPAVLIGSCICGLILVVEGWLMFHLDRAWAALRAGRAVGDTRRGFAVLGVGDEADDGSPDASPKPRV